MSDRELTLTKIINAPRRSVWRCWTEAALLRQWFAPRPWTTPRAELDVRPGGASLAVLTFEALDGGNTKYVARALHWTTQDREQHEKMGFHQGWAQCADQLQEVAGRLA
jgi:uncharacterized protein YndB with AHSA1/START domain